MATNALPTRRSVSFLGLQYWSTDALLVSPLLGPTVARLGT